MVTSDQTFQSGQGARFQNSAVRTELFHHVIKTHNVRDHWLLRTWVK